MATAKTDFSISANVLADTSQVQKTLNHKVFNVNAKIDFDTRKVQTQLNNLFKSPQSLQGFERINTKIRTGLKGITQDAQGVTTEVKNLIKYTETFKNPIGDVQERVTLLTKNGKILGQSLQTVAHGVKEITTDTKKFNQTLNGINTSVTQVTKTWTDTSGKTQQIIEKTTEWTDANGRLNTTIETLDEKGNQVAPTIRNVNDAIQKTGKTSVQSSKEVKSFGQSLSDAFVRLSKYYLATLPIKAFRVAISEAVKDIKDFDAAITEMGKVSDYSGERLLQYTKDLSKIGEEVARTRTEITEAATGWIKAGYSEEDAAILTKYSSLLQNTADEELSAADATSILVSQLKAYHMEAEEAVKVTDIINKVSANQAVSSADISKGLQQASSSMATFGNTIEQTTALLTGGTTIFQGQSQRVARALNTIAIRVTKNKDALLKYGVVVENTDGSLRSTYDILTELSKSWKTMSDAERVALGATLAGTNQYRILSAVMSQMDVVQESYQQALNASGETMKQNAVYMESLEAKTTALRTEFENFVLGNGGLQSFAKTLLTIGTDLVKFVNSIGGLKTAFVALAGVLLTIKIDNILKGFQTFNSFIVHIIPNLKNYISLWRTLRSEGKSVSETLKGMAISASTAQMAMGALAIVATACAVAFGQYQKAQQEAHDIAIQAQQDYNAYLSSLDDTYNKINLETASKKDLIDINKKLNDSYDDEEAQLKNINELRKENLQLLYEENKQKAQEAIRKNATEVQKAQELLTESYIKAAGDDMKHAFIRAYREAWTGEAADIYREALGYNNDKLLTNNLSLVEAMEKVGETIDKLERKRDSNIGLTDAEAEALSVLVKEYGYWQPKIEEANNTLDLNNTYIENANQSLGDFINNLKGIEIPKEVKNRLKELGEGGNVNLTLRPVIDAELLNKAGYDAGQGVATVFSHTFTNEAKDIAMNFTPIIADPETGEFFGIMNPKEFDEYCSNVVNGVSEDSKNLQIGVAFKKDDYDNFIESAENAGKEISKLHGQIYDASALSSESINELIEQYDITEDEIYDVMDANSDLNMSREEAVRLLAEEHKALLDNKQTWEELDKAYKDALESTSSLVSEISNLSSALEEQEKNGQLSLETQLKLIESGYATALMYDEETGACKLDKKAVEQLVEAKLQMQIANLESVRSSIVSTLLEEANSATVAAGAFLQLAQTKNVASKAYVERGGADPSKSYAGYGGNFGYLTVESKKAEQQIQALDKEIEALEKTLGNVGKSGVGAFKDIGKSAGGAKNKTDDLKKSTEELKSQYDKVISFITGRIDKQTKAIQKEKDSAIDSIEAQIKAREKQKDKALDAIEEEINALKKEKDARKKYWDEQIDALKKANDERKDALELQEKLDALERAKNTKVKVYKEGQGFVYDVDQNAVAEAQKALDEYLSEKAYEDELERLNELKDAEQDNYDARLDALNEYKDNVQASYEKQIEALEKQKEALEEQYDAQIEYYNNFKEQFEDMVKAYEDKQTELLATQLTGINFENNNWMTRLDNLAKFVSEYNRLQEQLNTGNTSVSNTATMKSGGGLPSGGGGGKTPANLGGSSGTGGTSAGKGFAGSQSGSAGLQKSALAANRKRVLGYASGTSSVDDDEIAIVGENPNKEIVIGSKLNNGQLMSLSKGTGVVNAESSNTLAGMLNQVGKFGSSGFGSGNGTLNNNINNDSLVVNGVTIQGANINDPQTFVNGLLNLKAEALQRAYRHR